MWTAGFEFSRRTLAIALRMFRWVYPVIAGLVLVSSFAVIEEGKGLAGIHPIFLAAMIVLIPILVSMQVCLGFALYHGGSPANRAFVEHAVKRAPGVIVTFIIVALIFIFSMLVPMALLGAAMPQLMGPLILMGASLAQMFGYIAVARFVDGGGKISESLTATGRFCLQNKGVLMVATLLVVVLPVIVDIMVDMAAPEMGEGETALLLVWRYLAQVPVMAMTTSLAAAAGVIAVTEGDWNKMNAPT